MGFVLKPCSWLKRRRYSSVSSGRSCPLSYRYTPSSLQTNHLTLNSEIIYVIGGLYGNPIALEHILENIAAREERKPLLVFNGDFNFFNCQIDGWNLVNHVIQENGIAIKGNVEDVVSKKTEKDFAEDCGCAYPSYVDDGTVQRSNIITSKLRTAAVHGNPNILDWMRGLQQNMQLSIGDHKISIVHGDAHSLSGWNFAAEAMPQNDSLRQRLGFPENEKLTTEKEIASWLTESQSEIFASTHTCLPVALDVSLSRDKENQRGVLINNGSAGMPNFREIPGGVITRISTFEGGQPPPGTSLYSFHGIKGLNINALHVDYDQEKWLALFQQWWPSGTPAHTSYFQRLKSRPTFSLSEAALGNFMINW
eukprot:CAMPEP_0117803762 /NCGR_PEP_ID=MMETSP0948-20121206/16647_1 /TAXON_ID=44440 /ORGANISM="Chattonella subsalsa, Strain CCMP2191" /LENGTH=365 /DNA_ID=CAMNT_0005637071 /DNA_START=6 /DNA_END=1100 /DNA_ORIENTATION=-